MWNYNSKRTSQLGHAEKTPWPKVRETENIPSITRSTDTGTGCSSGSTRKSKEPSLPGLARLKEEKDILEVSRNFTVAPAYNKGAYQVISKENIEYIGR